MIKKIANDKKQTNSIPSKKTAGYKKHATISVNTLTTSSFDL